MTSTSNPTANLADNFVTLLAGHEPPCLSLYLPTSRRHPENQQDPIRFKNLLSELERSLGQGYSASRTATLLKPFRDLASQPAFWNHTWDGLAIFGAADFFRVVKLQQTVAELAVVANSFHVKPLLPILHSSGRYHVLCLSRGEIKLFEGDRDHLDEIELAPAIPRTASDLGGDPTEPHLTVASYGGTGQGGAMHHGHGSKNDEAAIDDERFFRAVDRAIVEHHSRPSGLPLVLAALTQHHSLFRRLSQNPHLAATGIEADPASLSNDQLRQRSWAILEPQFLADVEALANEFRAALAKGMGSDDMGEIARAAAASRVQTLLIDVSCQIPGRLNGETGEITSSPSEDPQTDDLVDDLAELVLSRKGKVLALTPSEMPTSSGVAAIFRF